MNVLESSQVAANYASVANLGVAAATLVVALLAFWDTAFAFLKKPE